MSLPCVYVGGMLIHDVLSRISVLVLLCVCMFNVCMYVELANVSRRVCVCVYIYIYIYIYMHIHT
jgi:hypothetical protein